MNVIVQLSFFLALEKKTYIEIPPQDTRVTHSVVLTKRIKVILRVDKFLSFERWNVIFKEEISSSNKHSSSVVLALLQRENGIRVFSVATKHAQTGNSAFGPRTGKN